MHKLMRAAAAAERERERERGREVGERKGRQTRLGCATAPPKNGHLTWAILWQVATVASCLPAACLLQVVVAVAASLNLVHGFYIYIHIQIYICLCIYIYFMCRIQKLQRGMHQVRQKREITLVNQRVAAAKIFLQ